MREIKFRAWDKENNMWCDTDLFIICPDNGIVIEIYYDDDNGHLVLDEVNHDAVLEQYTGLKDKNGVDIYEGDIISFQSEYDDFKTLVGVFEYTEFAEWKICGIPLSEIHTCLHVIGNIHENADLLNDTDRISPDDIGNDIHEFLHGGDK